MRIAKCASKRASCKRNAAHIDTARLFLWALANGAGCNRLLGGQARRTQRSPFLAAIRGALFIAKRLFIPRSRSPSLSLFLYRLGSLDSSD